MRRDRAVVDGAHPRRARHGRTSPGVGAVLSGTEGVAVTATEPKEWDRRTDYEPGDRVRFEGRCYRALIGSRNFQPAPARTLKSWAVAKGIVIWEEER